MLFYETDKWMCYKTLVSEQLVAIKRQDENDRY